MHIAKFLHAHPAGVCDVSKRYMCFIGSCFGLSANYHNAVMLDIGVPVFALYVSNSKLQDQAVKHLDSNFSHNFPKWVSGLQYSSTEQ